MSDLLNLSLAQARTALRAKTISSVELTQHYLDRMAQNKKWNVYITETQEHALAMAATSDARLQKNEGGALEGIPLAIKDLFCTKGVLTTSASKMLSNFTPPYESTVTQNLWDAGGVMLGKVNMDEFAMGSSNRTSYYGPVINPWQSTASDEDLVSGGSSGGSVAAVAGGLALAATASDTGGSIRLPASFTGTVGIKPTYGRCSRYGMVAFASSLDQAGPITRDVRDGAIMLESMCGYDVKDSTSSPRPVPSFEAALEYGVKGLKIGIPKEYMMDGMSDETLALWDQGKAWLRDAGAEIVDISLPHTAYGLAAYYVLAPAEASSNLSRYDGVRYGLRVEGSTLDELYENTRGAGFGDEVKRRILIGTYVLSSGYYDAYYLKAQKVRAKVRHDFEQAFQQVDAILTPSTMGPAFGLSGGCTDPVSMYLNDVFTVTANLAGIPGMSLPAGLTTDGLPLGLQVLGRAFDEETMLRVAYAIEQAADFKSWLLKA